MLAIAIIKKTISKIKQESNWNQQIRLFILVNSND